MPTKAINLVISPIMKRNPTSQFLKRSTLQCNVFTEIYPKICLGLNTQYLSICTGIYFDQDCRYPFYWTPNFQEIPLHIKVGILCFRHLSLFADVEPDKPLLAASE